MYDNPAGPIEKFSWGRFQIKGVIHAEDGQGAGKDICILRGEVLPWKTRKGHQLKPKMVEIVLDQGVSTLVIGNGVYGRVKVLKKTKKKLENGGIKTLIIEKTPDACAIYNRLVSEGEFPAFLAHGTC